MCLPFGEANILAWLQEQAFGWLLSSRASVPNQIKTSDWESYLLELLMNYETFQIVKAKLGQDYYCAGTSAISEGR